MWLRDYNHIRYSEKPRTVILPIPLSGWRALPIAYIILSLSPSKLKLHIIISEAVNMHGLCPEAIN